MGSQGGENSQQGGGLEDQCRQGIGWCWLADWDVPYLHADKPGGTTGERHRPYNPDSRAEK